VSWLLAAFIPALLMLATFGLQRLESSLDADTVSASDVAEFLDQAEADDVNTLAREGMSRALDGLHQRLGERDWPPRPPNCGPRHGKFAKSAVHASPIQY
jgi:hypothetical protein